MRRLVLVVLLFIVSPAIAGDYSFKLHQVRLVDVVRLIGSDVLGASYSLPPELVADDAELSVDVHDLSKAAVREYLVDLLASRGYVWRQEGAVFFARRSDAVEDFIVYKPVFRSAKYLSDIVRSVTGEKTLAAREVRTSSQDRTGAGAQGQSQASGITDQPGTVGALLDKNDFDQLAYRCRPEVCARIRSLLAQVDTEVSQVVLRAVVYEVNTNNTEGSAWALAARLLRGKVQLAMPAPSPGVQLQIVNGGLQAVVAALDTDAHFHTVTKPFVRVLSGQKARFEVGQKVPVLGAVSTPANGAPVQSVEYRDSGTIFTVTPDVRREVISLDVTQEISTFAPTSTGVNNSPTLNVRKLTSQLALKPGEVVVLGGLDADGSNESGAGLFGFHFAKSAAQSSQSILLFLEAEAI